MRFNYVNHSQGLSRSCPSASSNITCGKPYLPPCPWGARGWYPHGFTLNQNAFRILKCKGGIDLWHILIEDCKCAPSSCRQALQDPQEHKQVRGLLSDICEWLLRKLLAWCYFILLLIYADIVSEGSPSRRMMWHCVTLCNYVSALTQILAWFFVVMAIWHLSAGWSSYSHPTAVRPSSRLWCDSGLTAVWCPSNERPMAMIPAIQWLSNSCPPAPRQLSNGHLTVPQGCHSLQS